ncbi:MAG: Wzt carbohydrate-binding domain-containing protein [Candidatus Thiodiazotropha sp.]
MFCSHALYQVRELCHNAIWLDQGALRMFGPVDEVVDVYQDHVRAQNRVQVAADPTPVVKSDAAEPEVREGAPGQKIRGWFEEVRLVAEVFDDLGRPIYATYDSFKISVIACAPDVLGEDIHFGVVIKRNDHIQCYGVSTLVDGVSMRSLGEHKWAIDFCIESLPLLSGEYLLDLYLLDASGMHVYDKRENSHPFQVRQKIKAVGMCWMDHHWS